MLVTLAYWSYDLYVLQMLVAHSLFILSCVCVCYNVGHPSLLVISPVCVTDVRCSQPIYHVTCVCVINVGHPSLLVISPVCVTDAVFGSSLQDLCDRDKSPVPSFVLLCITAVESKGTFFVDYYTAEFVRSESNRKVLDLLHSRCCLFKSKQWYSCFWPIMQQNLSVQSQRNGVFVFDMLQNSICLFKLVRDLKFNTQSAMPVVSGCLWVQSEGNGHFFSKN